MFGEVEKDIRIEGFQFLAQQIEIVENREMLRRVTERAERGHDVGLGFPILGLQLRVKS